MMENFFSHIDAQTWTAISALLLSIVNFIITDIKHKTSLARLSQIEKSDLNGLYLTCPKCGTKIPLNSVPISKEVTIKDETVQKVG